MAQSKRYNLAYRRQREGRTNYKSRLALLKSGIPRLIIRKTNKYFIIQVATYDTKGDLVSVNAHSAELSHYGWNAGKGNLPAGYLTGYLAGMRIKAASIPTVIADFGLQNVAHKGTLFAVLKGVVDAGVDIPVNAEFFPDEARIKGEHIKSYAAKAEGTQFSKTKKDAASITSLFTQAKQAITAKPAQKAKTKKE